MHSPGQERGLSVGIEAMNVFAGTAFVNVEALAEHRGLDTSRFSNLLMKEKTVALPFEDPVSFGINAAKPIVDALSSVEKDRIEMVIASTESSFDFGKSMSTYFHKILGLNRNCRLFELKNACYSGVAGLQMAVNFILSQASPGAKALVIASDISRFSYSEGDDPLLEDWSFAEPSNGAGAVALLVGETPTIFEVDVGANGYYGYEVMDTCRPLPDSEAGDSDLSLLSYLDCCENSFLEYQKRVPEADYGKTFDYLAYHTPFGGMVKGAHRKLMRKMAKASSAEIQTDFERRVSPGLEYCQRVGNIMGATAMLSLLSTIEHGTYASPKRVGVFSYGSGCCSEFFSGIVSEAGQMALKKMKTLDKLNSRYELSMDEYDRVLLGNHAVGFGTRHCSLPSDLIPQARTALGQEVLFLQNIKDFHREYNWCH